MRIHSRMRTKKIVFFQSLNNEQLKMRPTLILCLTVWSLLLAIIVYSQPSPEFNHPSFEKANETFDQGSYEKAAMEYGELANQYLIKEDYQTYGMAQYQSAICYVFLGKFQQADSSFQKVLDYIDQYDLLELEALTYSARGFLLYNAGFYRKAIPFFRKLMAIRKRQEDPRYSSAMIWLGYCYQFLDQPDSTYRYLSEALTLKEEVKDSEQLGLAYELMGQYYSRQYDYDLAIEYYLKALEVDSQINYYNDLVNLFLKTNDIEHAQEYNNQAFDIIEKRGIKYLRTDALFSKGLLLEEVHKLDSAIKVYKEALEIATNHDQLKKQKSASAFLADAYIQKQNYQQAESYLDQYERLAIELNDTFALANALIKKGLISLNTDQPTLALQQGTAKIIEKVAKKHLVLARKQAELMHKVYAANGNYLDAYQQSNTFIRLNDSVGLLEQNEKYLELEARYDRSEKEQEIVKLNAANELKDIKIQNANMQRLGLMLGLLLLSIIAFLIFRAARIRKRTNEKLSIALHEKNMLLKEIHHRVKNNLQVISSLLSLQSRYVKDEKALSALNEGQNRVDSMALIHQNLYRGDNLSGVHMDKYIPQLADNVLSTYESSSERIQLKYDIDSIILDVSTVVPIGLVLNELVSNAMKYAFPENRKGTIQIGLHDHGEELELYVLDNGIGMPLNAEDLGFGSKLIKSFTRKLEGDLSITNENGTKVYLRIRNFKSASRDAFVESINQ